MTSLYTVILARERCNEAADAIVNSIILLVNEMLLGVKSSLLLAVRRVTADDIAIINTSFEISELVTIAS
jgi:hypothetical protein